MTEWSTRFAEVVAESLRHFYGIIGDAPIAMFVVNCYPWSWGGAGAFELSILTQDEVNDDPQLLDSAEFGAWEHYNILVGFECGDKIKEIEEEMRQSYSNATDKAAIATEYFRACGTALTSPQVQSALSKFSLVDGFRLSVPNPDTGEEFYPNL